MNQNEVSRKWRPGDYSHQGTRLNQDLVGKYGIKLKLNKCMHGIITCHLYTWNRVDYNVYLAINVV